MGNLFMHVKPSQIATLVGIVLSALGAGAMGVANAMRNQEANEAFVNMANARVDQIFNMAGDGVEIHEI